MDLERLTVKLLAKFCPLREVSADRVKDADTAVRESGRPKSSHGPGKTGS